MDPNRFYTLLITLCGVVVAAVVVSAALDYAGYGAKWMGFSEDTTETKETTTLDPSRSEVSSIAVAEDPQRSKTLWDWMQILVIPVAVAIGTFVLNETGKRRDQAAEAAQQLLQERRAQNDAFQAYLDQMSWALLEYKPTPGATPAALRTLVRARTLTVLDVLDGTYKGRVVQFLSEAGLISRMESRLEDEPDTDAPLKIVSLSGANLDAANLSYLNLREAALDGAFLERSNLRFAYLPGADLGGTWLHGADLTGANLTGASLREARLNSRPDSRLASANLTSADLSYADLRGADLQDANLSHADLSGAMITKDQLDAARSIEGAKLPEDLVRH